MSAANSPHYKQGRADGSADALRISTCPPQPAIGPTPVNTDYRRMYDRGYDEVFGAAVPHICTERCKK